MYALVYRVRALTEDKWNFADAGTVRISHRRMANVLAANGYKGTTMGPLLRGDEPIPADLVRDLRKAGGRISGRKGVRHQSSGYNPAKESKRIERMLKKAYSEARKNAASWDDASTIADYAEMYPDSLHDALQTAAHDVAMGLLYEPAIKMAYAELPVSGGYDLSVPTRGTFIDILADIVWERMSKGIKKYERRSKKAR